MGQVYSTAKDVLIWLGDGPVDVEKAFEFIKRFENGLEMYEPEVIQSMHRIGSGTSTLWRALSLVLNKPWFTRLWIIQEVVMAVKARVFCGNQTSSWSALTKAVNWIFENNLGSWLQGLSHLAITRISFIQKLWFQNQGVTDSPILLLLDLFDYTKSTDPRNKVYALLSLTSGTPYINPDYSISCEELYTSIAVRHLTPDIPYVLCCVDYSVNDSGLRLPSWVSNWAAKSLRNGHNIAFQFLKSWGFKAAADTKPQLTYSEHDQVLSVTGLIFDTISHTAEHLYDSTQHLSFGPEDYQDKFSHRKKRLQEFDALAVDSRTYPGHETFEDAYSQLFVMNQPVELKNGNYRSDELHRICYQAMRDFLLHLDEIMSGEMNVEDIRTSDTIDAYLHVINKTIPYRRFCATKKHYLGWLPAEGRAGIWFVYSPVQKFHFSFELKGTLIIS
ncbi:hypothetical protein MMC13_002817 [Lambiella insularis]|nr:hypothetical protein [Lambiella insularis]